MKLSLKIEGSIEDILRDKRKMMGIAATGAIRESALALQSAWRGQVLTAGLGQKVANAIRVEDFPKKDSGKFSYSPAAKIFTNADYLLSAFNNGALIKAKSGIWLAIPTKEVGATGQGRKLTPAEWSARTGRALRFVRNSRTGKAFLVADDVRINKRGLVAAKGGKRRKDGILTGAQTIVVFMLVYQATLRKRLDFDGATRRIESALPGLILSQWKD